MKQLSGAWSRRIDDANRLLPTADDDAVRVAACRYPYGDRFRAQRRSCVAAIRVEHKRLGHVLAIAAQVQAQRDNRRIQAGPSHARRSRSATTAQTSGTGHQTATATECRGLAARHR